MYIQFSQLVVAELVPGWLTALRQLLRPQLRPVPRKAGDQRLGTAYVAQKVVGSGFRSVLCLCLDGPFGQQTASASDLGCQLA